mmetsp:Transcript_702/g.1239  ORF Transcript_702/g.1239 Transcript_702/m.1239 type:complete len:310 (+) Transcript_702:377-1306(+)
MAPSMSVSNRSSSTPGRLATTAVPLSQSGGSRCPSGGPPSPSAHTATRKCSPSRSASVQLTTSLVCTLICRFASRVLPYAVAMSDRKPTLAGDAPPATFVSPHHPCSAATAAADMARGRRVKWREGSMAPATSLVRNHRHRQAPQPTSLTVSNCRPIIGHTSSDSSALITTGVVTGVSIEKEPPCTASKAVPACASSALRLRQSCMSGSQTPLRSATCWPLSTASGSHCQAICPTVGTSSSKPLPFVATQDGSGFDKLNPSFCIIPRNKMSSVLFAAGGITWSGAEGRRSARAGLSCISCSSSQRRSVH